MTAPGSSQEERRAALILEHLPRVRWIAGRIHQRLPSGVVLEDLISIGVLGLIEAVDRFDPELNVQFKSYAEHRIRGAILDSVCELDGVPAHKRSKAKRLRRAVSTVEQNLGHTPCSEEVAEELGVSLEEYHEWVNDVRGVSVASLAAVRVTDKSEISLADTIADPDGIRADDMLQQTERDALVRRGLQTLPVLERRVIGLYFQQGLCLREIASMLNLHITRISQIKASATQRLRRFIESRWSAHNGGAAA
jgi:RNA polymerase sigma factor FliA